MNRRIAAAITVAAGLGIATATRLAPRRATQTRPAPSAADVAAGLVAFAVDLTTGDLHALESIGPRGEMPTDPQEWADYPDDWYRQARIAYLGDNRGAHLPDEVYDALNAAGWTPGQPLPDTLHTAA